MQEHEEYYLSPSRSLTDAEKNLIWESQYLIRSAKKNGALVKK